MLWVGAKNNIAINQRGNYAPWHGAAFKGRVFALAAQVAAYHLPSRLWVVDADIGCATHYQLPLPAGACRKRLPQQLRWAVGNGG